MQVRTGRGHERRIDGACGAVLACWLLTCAAGCDERARMDMDCATSFDDLSYQPTRGTFELGYDGWAGRAPASLGMHVRSTTAESVYMQCGYADDVYWWVDASLSVPITVAPPAQFDEGLGASVQFWSCGVEDCADSQRRASLGAALGTVHQFDPILGILRADYTLSDNRPGSVERDSLTVRAQLTWLPDYAPTLEGTLDGRWVIQSVERLAAEEDLVLYIELLQAGPRLTAHACDAEWVCRMSDWAGTFADPRLRATWTQQSVAAGQRMYELRVQIEDAGRSFTGRLQRGSETGRPTAYWNVTGRRIE